MPTNISFSHVLTREDLVTNHAAKGVDITRSFFISLLNFFFLGLNLHNFGFLDISPKSKHPQNVAEGERSCHCDASTGISCAQGCEARRSSALGVLLDDWITVNAWTSTPNA